MSDFLTTGFTLQFVKDILEKIQTGYTLIDLMITFIVILSMNRDARKFIIGYINLNNIYEYVSFCYHNRIEYRMSSNRKTTFIGSYNSCNEKMLAVCHKINTEFGNDNIDSSGVSYFEEYVTTEHDGYDDENEDKSFMVPIGKLIFHIEGITLKIYLVNKENEEQKGQKVQYKQIDMVIYGKTHESIEDFIEKILNDYKISRDVISNKEIKWFRLRSIFTRNDFSIPLYFSKPLQHKAEFDNLYFDGKDRLIKMLDDLGNNKRERNCLLLHGPPGSGKDSIAVAITKYLSNLNKIASEKKNMKTYNKRHIIAYPMDLFQKSDDFMRVFYGTDKIDNVDIPNDLQVKLFPEVEKYSDVMLKKDIQDIIKKKTDPKEANDDIFEYIKQKSELDISQDDFELISMIKSVQGNNASSKNMPQLKLGPILECLDSFMNQKGTMVIFTTNLPIECIDDVLIRHERLDKFYLGPSSMENTSKILDTYYPSKNRLKGLSDIPIGKLMPSDISYYCKISSTRDECIQMLKKHV
jgi:tRNA A37 threonylcarbamoyladenosine biosynthesis protein TsaE